MQRPRNSINPLLVSDDLHHHQLRVLLLIVAVAAQPGTGHKLDGLTKLAKLDFLVRYPSVISTVRATLLGEPASVVDVDLSSELPMIRYKFGPWDEIYYPVVGALIGRGLIKYTKGRAGSVAMAATASGKKLAKSVGEDVQWSEVAQKYFEVAQTFGTYSGNQLKEAIYKAIPDALDVPHRTVIS